jgi:hypothetical protein
MGDDVVQGESDLTKPLSEPSGPMLEMIKREEGGELMFFMRALCLILIATCCVKSSQNLAGYPDRSQ